MKWMHRAEIKSMLSPLIKGEIKGAPSRFCPGRLDGGELLSPFKTIHYVSFFNAVSGG